MKRIMLIFTLFAVLFSGTVVYADTYNVEVNTVDATVEVSTSSDYSNFKAIIEKDGVKYFYDLYSTSEALPLQMGNGKYKISILGSQDGRRYKSLLKDTVDVKVDENAVFLSASQIVNWDDDSELVTLAKELTKDAQTDQEKLEIIHGYISKNVQYDYGKATVLPKGYIPNPEATLESNKGICYDFAALTGAMLRAVDVPTKLVKGYSKYTTVYHAWNEVLIDGEWVIVDCSTDSIYVAHNASIEMVKAEADYETSKVY